MVSDGGFLSKQRCVMHQMACIGKRYGKANQMSSKTVAFHMQAFLV